ncbi:flavodoxin family protein [Candidatus Dojkabacteria bacterium]|nr:flavodoxin family protein [Candidatus Dojkabacteria bacterium]
MSKILIIYGSTTGMTELVAFEIEKTLKENKVEVALKNVLEANINDLADFDNVLFGVSTWDFGCLQYDFEPFHVALKTYDLTGKKFSVFGTGDKSYGDSYCEAVRIVKQTCLDQGGDLLIERLEVECDLTDDRLEEVRNWAKEIALGLN